MPLIIQGAGTAGHRADVTDRGQVKTESVSLPYDMDVNIRDEHVWSLPFKAQAVTGADDYFFYIANTGDKVIHVSDIRIESDTATTRIECQQVSGTPVGGTSATPVNRTLDSSQIPSATIQGGADITGLSSGGVLFFIQCTVADTIYHLRTTSKIRIPKGKAFALLASKACTVTGVVSLIEEGD